MEIKKEKIILKWLFFNEAVDFIDLIDDSYLIKEEPIFFIFTYSSPCYLCTT